MFWIALALTSLVLLTAAAAPLIMGWSRRLVWGAVALTIAAFAGWADYVYQCSGPDYHGSALDGLGVGLLEAAAWLYWMGLGTRSLIVSFMSLRGRHKYGDIRPLASALRLWWTGRSTPSLSSRLAWALGVSLPAALLLAGALIPWNGRWPFSLFDSWPWYLAGPTVLVGLGVGIPLGLVCWDAPVRWAAAGSLPPALSVIALSWLNRFDIATAQWSSYWIGMGKFMALVCAAALTAAHLRQQFSRRPAL